MATLSVTWYYPSSITVHISGLANPEGEYGGFRFRINGGAWQNSTSTYKTFSGLTSGTDYSFDSEAQWAGVWYSSGSCSGHTSVVAPSITFDTKTSTWIQVITHNNDSGGNLATYIDGVSVEDSRYSYQRTGDYLLVAGLEPDTEYQFYCRVFKNGYSASSGTLYITTNAPPRPNNFSWTYAKTSGGNFNLTASEWNSFTSRINEFRNYKGLADYSFNSAITGFDFSAQNNFNQAVNALSALSAYFTGGNTIPSTKSQGNNILASYLTNLVNAMNSIL